MYLHDRTYPEQMPHAVLKHHEQREVSTYVVTKLEVLYLVNLFLKLESRMIVTILYGSGGNRRTVFDSIEHTGNWR